mmetsp:Transcript_7973/g.13233  ORF Transcript_7973/g.13233 Transcript_7973/m.13233 type:complete len:203 (+) Transcript_7973:153-761(+)
MTETKVELQHASIKYAQKPISSICFPFFIDHLEGHILVGRACVESNNSKVVVRYLVSLTILLHTWLDKIFWCFGFVDQIRVENREFVSLDHFRRRVVAIIVRQIVLGAEESSPNSVEVAGLSWTVFIIPGVGFAGECDFCIRLHLLLAVFVVKDGFDIRSRSIAAVVVATSTTCSCGCCCCCSATFLLLFANFAQQLQLLCQ